MGKKQFFNLIFLMGFIWSEIAIAVCFYFLSQIAPLLSSDLLLSFCLYGLIAIGLIFAIVLIFIAMCNLID